MVNMEIVEGLKEAMARGESLKQAMFSFYNAGYGKQEIEDSARYLLQILQAERQRILAQRQIQAEQQKPLNQAKQPLQQQIQKPITTQPVPQPPQQQIQKPQHQLQPLQQPIQKPITTQPVPQPPQQQFSQQPTKTIQPQIQQQIPQKQIQKVSNYNQQAKSNKITIILLIFILVILFGALVVMFLFKDKVIELFNNLF